MRKEKSLIEIAPGTLAEGRNEFNFTCNAADFVGRGLADAGFTREIGVNVVAEKSDDEITITINTSTLADFTCDVCLAPVSKKLTGTFVLSCLFATPFDDGNKGDEEYLLIDKNADSIDITEEVCETLLLSLPMKVTCTNNPDCKLYNSRESTEKNEETRSGDATSWQEALEKLKNKYR